MADEARRCSVFALLLALAGVATAEDAPKVDVEFLEFLGSVDAEDEGWMEFLASADRDESSAATDAAKAGKTQVKDHEP